MRNNELPVHRIARQVREGDLKQRLTTIAARFRLELIVRIAGAIVVIPWAALLIWTGLTQPTQMP